MLRTISSRQWPEPVAVHTVPSEYMVDNEHELDEAHCLVWTALRHLFPPHAVVSEPKSGWLSITWSTEGDPDATYRYATPVVVRLEAELVDALWAAPTLAARCDIASLQEPAVRTGLCGYNPYSSIPNARVIVLG